LRRTVFVACVVLGGCAAVFSGDTRSRAQREGALKVGDEAPDFTLKSPDGQKGFTLWALRGQRPVVLIFTSCT